MCTLRQEKYFEIRSSEVAANKIHKHLQNLLANRPRMYKKTLVRYKDLAYLLIDCVDMILRFLTNELLSSSEDNEFNELSSSDCPVTDDADVNEIRRKLTESTQLFETYNTLASSSTIVTALPVENPEQAPAVDCGAMAKVYGDVLEAAANIDYGYVEVNDCAKLIHYWYSHRMLYMSTHHKAYNIAQLPNWISCIVLMYSKYHANGQPTFFANTLMQWCDTANETFSNKYAIPKEVINIGKSSYMNDYTVDALIIYDLLMEQGFLPLVNPDSNIVPMDPNFIVDRTKEHNPNLDKVVRTRISKRTKYIEEIGLTPSDTMLLQEGVKA